jgi:hypothetical protein
VDDADSSTATSYNDYSPFALCRGELVVCLSSTGFDSSFLSLDVDLAVPLCELEVGDWVESWGIFDISRGDLEAG